MVREPWCVDCMYGPRTYDVKRKCVKLNRIVKETSPVCEHFLRRVTFQTRIRFKTCANCVFRANETGGAWCAKHGVYRDRVCDEWKERRHGRVDAGKDGQVA